MFVKQLIWSCLLIFLISSLSTSFSQQASLKFQKLSRDADIILTGKVTKQQSAWNQNKTRIITYTTIEAEEYLKGNTSKNFLIVNHPGGEVGDVGEIYTHMPTFKDDEKVLLFLKNDKKSDGYKVLYGEDGKIDIMKSGSGEMVTASNIPIRMLKAQIQKYVSHQ
jgi:hypothetical protein